MIVAKPVHPASYALGKALAPLLLSILSMVFFGAIMTGLGFLTLLMLAWIVPALVIVWAATSTLGFMISTYLLKSSTLMLNNLSNLLGIGPHFHSASLLFRSPARKSELDIRHHSNVERCGSDEILYGATAAANRGRTSLMGRPHHNNNGVHHADFRQGKMAGKIVSPLFLT
jgi:hypothetical protein